MIASGSWGDGVSSVEDLAPILSRLICCSMRACVHKYTRVRAPCVMPAVLLEPQEWFMHGRVTANLIQLQPANLPHHNHWRYTASGDLDFSELPDKVGILPRSITHRSRAYDATSSYQKR